MFVFILDGCVAGLYGSDRGSARYGGILIFATHALISSWVVAMFFMICSVSYEANSDLFWCSGAVGSPWRLRSVEVVDAARAGWV